MKTIRMLCAGLLATAGVVAAPTTAQAEYVPACAYHAKVWVCVHDYALLAWFNLVEPGTPATVRAAAYVDRYRFTVDATGTTFWADCVTVTDPAAVNGCAAAGGTFETRELALVDLTDDVPQTEQVLGPLAVCAALLDIAPAYSQITVRNAPVVVPCTY